MIRFVILGQPASKANSREIGKKRMFSRKKGASVLVPLLRKSDVALNYESHAQTQIPVAARQELQGPVRVTLRIFYRTHLSDLDESIVLDVLQSRFVKVIDRYEHVGEGQYAKVMRKKKLWAGVYLNDRQVKEKHIYHGIDKLNPRTEVEIEQIIPELPLQVADLSTPETDAHAITFEMGFPVLNCTEVVDAEVSRRIERERNSLRDGVPP